MSSFNFVSKNNTNTLQLEAISTEVFSFTFNNTYYIYKYNDSTFYKIVDKNAIRINPEIAFQSHYKAFQDKIDRCRVYDD